MDIHLLRQEDEDRWNRFVEESGSSSCYHLSGWKNVIEKSFGHKTYYLFAENENGEISGILPLVQLKSMLFGNFMVSLPYFNYGGICTSNRDVYAQLLEQAARIAEREKVSHIELRHTENKSNDLPEKAVKVSMRLILPLRSEELFDGFSAKLRNQIRRPLKEHMHVSIGREGMLKDFYAVFSQNMRDLGTPVYSREFFGNILREFPKTTKICIVYTKDRKPVASGFLVGFKERMEIPWASSLRSYNRFGPNMLLYWGALQLACEQGYRVFDFGRSTFGEGTYKFKEQWGAKPTQLYWHYWMSNGQAMPELNPNNPKYRMAINIWKRLPLGITKLIGPAIVKNLP